MFRRHPGGRREVENGRALRTQRRALELRGQVAVAPVRRAALRVADLGQDDETGQILIDRTEPVVHPRAYSRITAEAVPRIHLIHRGGMIDAVDGATAEEAKLIRDLREMRPVRGHVGAALSCLDEGKRAAHVVALAALHRRLLLSLADEFLEVHLLEHGLRIEGVDVRGTALHHQEDDVFRLRPGEVALFRSERIRLFLRREQRGQGNAPERGTETVNELAPRRDMEGAGAGTGEVAFSKHKQTRWNLEGRGTRRRGRGSSRRNRRAGDPGQSRRRRGASRRRRISRPCFPRRPRGAR